MSEKKSLIETVRELVNEAKKQVMETKAPSSVEILSNDTWTLQLLVVPPSTRTYGATTVERDLGVLLQIRNNVNWRNSLTIPDRGSFEALNAVIKAFAESNELQAAVFNVLTGRKQPSTRPTLRISE